MALAIRIRRRNSNGSVKTSFAARHRLPNGSHETTYNRSDGHRLTVSIVEATHLLAIGRTLAYEAARRGDLRTIRVGRRVLVPVLAIEELRAQASEVTESSVRRTRSEP